jgi:hypothetical protein
MKVRIDDHERYPFYECSSFDDWKQSENGNYIEGVDDEKDAHERFEGSGAVEMPTEIYNKLSAFQKENDAVQDWLRGISHNRGELTQEDWDEFPIK